MRIKMRSGMNDGYLNKVTIQDYNTKLINALVLEFMLAIPPIPGRCGHEDLRNSSPFHQYRLHSGCSPIPGSTSPRTRHIPTRWSYHLCKLSSLHVEACIGFSKRNRCILDHTFQ